MPELKEGKAPWWTVVPPAIFPPVLGLFALANGWRVAMGGAGATPWLGYFVTVLAVIMLLVGATAFSRKISRRPGVIWDDLKGIPGRAGIAALILSSYLFAGVLVPIAPVLAEVILWSAFVAHGGLVVMMITILRSAPPDMRKVTPVFHLHFVGFIVMPQAAVPLGYTGFAFVVFCLSLVLAAIIWLASLQQGLRASLPPPMRPLLAIHLAPIALLGSVALLFGYDAIALGFGFTALVALAVIFARGRYLLAAGFTPMWGALTFPLASSSTLLLALAQADGSWPFMIAGMVTLLVASVVNPYVAMRVWKSWAAGALASKTGAARA